MSLQHGTTVKYLDVVEYTCNARAWEEEMKISELTGQSVEPLWEIQIQWENLSQKRRWEVQEEDTQCWPMFSTCTSMAIWHTCAHTYKKHTCILKVDSQKRMRISKHSRSWFLKSFISLHTQLPHWDKCVSCWEGTWWMSSDQHHKHCNCSHTASWFGPPYARLGNLWKDLVYLSQDYIGVVWLSFHRFIFILPITSVLYLT